MAREEVRQALANWIGQAVSPSGRLPDETELSEWVTDRFNEWWRERVEDPLLDAERAASGIKSELYGLAGGMRSVRHCTN